MNFVLAGLIVVMMFAHFMALRSANLAHERERRIWDEERAYLLDRVQAPERAVIRQAAAEQVAHVVPEDEGELAKVGTVVWGDAE